MQGNSLWLGSLRGPVKLAMIASLAVTGLLFVWLVANQFISEDAIGMHEMIRPQGRPIVWAMLIAVSSSVEEPSPTASGTSFTGVTLIGTGANPNVAAVVVIGIEPEWTNIIVDGIAETGKPVTGFSIERHGEIKTVEMASWKAKEYMHQVSE